MVNKQKKFPDCQKCLNIKNNAPLKYAKIHTERRMFKKYCSRLKKYAFYENVKYGETS